MLKNRKSQGLPIQVIIIAVIGLFVLAVSLYIFSTQSGKAASSLESCYTRGGECGDVGCSGSQIRLRDVECPTDEGKICCITIKKQDKE